MAKMTRNDLKSLVKECLFEILLEATDAESGQQLQEVRLPKKKTRPVTSRRPALDNISIGKSQPAREQPQFDVSQITSDPVMAAIFQDTAKTTLLEQSRAERLGPQSGGDAATAAMAQADPQEVFGEASRNWAALAFND